MSSTVFIVDDDASVREAIEPLVRAEGLAAECHASAESFLRTYTPERPGCLVVDLRLPGVNGAELLERLPANPIRLPAIVLTGHADVPSILRATRAGSVAFLEKPFNPHVLQRHIRETVSSDRRARQEHAQRNEIQKRITQLTPREKQVLEFVVAGKSNREVALLLQRSQKTVEVHRTNVMRKMRAGNVAELVRLAVESGGLAAATLPRDVPVEATPSLGA